MSATDTNHCYLSWFMSEENYMELIWNKIKDFTNVCPKDTH